MIPPSILLIDEDPDSLVMYSLVLEHHGYRVLSASCGDDGFRLACEQRPDLVITELHLFDRSPESLAERLKRDVRTSTTPVVAITAVPVRSGAPSRGLAVCDRFLEKPCVPSRLLAEVQDLLGDAGGRRQRPN